MGLLHVCHGGVIVTGQRNGVAAAVVHEVGAVWFCVFGLQLVGLRDLLLKLLLAPALFACVVGASLLNVFHWRWPGVWSMSEIRDRRG